MRREALARPLPPEADLRRQIDALVPWFHNIELAPGVHTAPDHFLGDYPAVKYRRFADALPADLSGISVLDIGCNAGFYCVEMKRRGAARVLGIDSDARYLAQARLVADTLGHPDIELRQCSVYDVATIGERFDLVLFMGLLYHLRHPLLALDLIRHYVAREYLLFQTMQQGSSEPFDAPADHPFHLPGTFDPPRYFAEPGYPKLHFIEHRFAGDWSNWWAPNAAGSQAMLRAAGFEIEQQLEAEVYWCRIAPVPYGSLGPIIVHPAEPAS